METLPPTRVQLCGLLVVELKGRRIEGTLPSRQGRLLFAYLTLNRGRPLDRDELIEALWPYAVPTAAPAALTVLLSKLRSAVGPEVLRGRGDVTLALPAAARVDVEDALAGVHEAESAVALGEGDAPGVRPCALSSSLGGVSYPSTKPRGSTRGAGAWTMCWTMPSRHTLRRASESAGPSWPAPNAPLDAWSNTRHCARPDIAC